MKKVIVRAPAKLNLALDILGLTEDGYHQIDMIMQAISLYEHIEVAKANGYSLRCPGSPVPANDKNTATKAAAVFFQETGLLAGADITLHKVVPTRAGMAGGSADAAGVLVALNHLYGARLNQDTLCSFGKMVGADVPFALTGGTARAEGIGEILTPLRSLPDCLFVIAMPSMGVSTPAAFGRYDEIGSPARPNIPACVQAIENGSLPRLAKEMCNVLEYANGDENTERIRNILDTHGAAASMMTGSGAATFGIFTDPDAAHKAKEVLQKQYEHVFTTHPVASGPEIIEVK